METKTINLKKKNIHFLRKKKIKQSLFGRKLSHQNFEIKKEQELLQEIPFSNPLWIQKVCHLYCDKYNTNLLFMM